MLPEVFFRKTMRYIAFPHPRIYGRRSRLGGGEEY